MSWNLFFLEIRWTQPRLSRNLAFRCLTLHFSHSLSMYDLEMRFEWVSERSRVCEKWMCSVFLWWLWKWRWFIPSFCVGVTKVGENIKNWNPFLSERRESYFHPPLIEFFWTSLSPIPSILSYYSPLDGWWENMENKTEIQTEDDTFLLFSPIPFLASTLSLFSTN